MMDVSHSLLQNDVVNFLSIEIRNDALITIVMPIKERDFYIYLFFLTGLIVY